MSFQNNWPCRKVLGSKLMIKSLDLLVRTQGYGIPWRRYLLVLMWIIGFCFFCGGIKIKLISLAVDWPRILFNPLLSLKLR